ncbi:MAG TPA: hypothetical protein H9875_07415 [Candidatus Levilactobacillus faecigallinarum]|uniref:Uncharacterized protein n=1 Tax=Candidatus Levilactobacillus faecigallinarum TaxID=2838638 RepID=A0A9D1QSV1_9LACO|nr:hypothetical protein [Candidatus Levilactobacillus faecigallinarum]
MTSLTAFFKNRTVQQLLVFTLCQNLLWWLVGSTSATGQPLTWRVKLSLGGYGIFLAAGYFLILRRHFQSHIGPILVVAAATLGLLAAPTDHLVQLFAVLLCIFLVLACIPQLQLQSIYGLVVFSFLAGCGVPVILFFLRNHYLATQFLLTLLPIMATYLAFFAQFYLPRPTDWRYTLIFPAILVIAILTISFSWKTIVAILLVVLHWALQRRLNVNYRLVVAGVTQLVVGYLLLR